MIIKNKWFFGLVYKKIDTTDKSFIIRVLGIKLLYSKVDILTSTEFIYFNGIKKPILKHNVRKHITDLYKQNLINKYDKYDSFIIFASGFGEISHVLFTLKDYLSQYDLKNPLIVFSKRGLEKLYKLYPNLDYPTCVIEDITGIMCEQFSTFGNKKFIVPLNFDYFGNVENNIIQNGQHYYSSLKENFNLKPNCNCSNLSISPNAKLIAKKIYKEKLNSKFVIICPEASTMEILPYDFWFRLSKKLNCLGYQVLLNTGNDFLVIENSIHTQLNYIFIEEIIELSKYATCIIGLRNGFLEILAEYSKRPVFTIYNKFNDFAQNKLTAEQVITGFSINELPEINKNLIFEYNYEKYKYFDILIDEIISQISLIACEDNKNTELSLLQNIETEIKELKKEKIRDLIFNIYDTPCYKPIFNELYHNICILENCSMRSMYIDRISKPFIEQSITNLRNKYSKKIYLLTDLDFSSEDAININVEQIVELKNYDENEYIILLAYNKDFLAKSALKELIKYNLKYYSLPQYGTPQARFFHTNQNAFDTLIQEEQNNPLTHICPLDSENIFQALEATRGLEGDLVEIGTFQGASARATLNYRNRSKINKKCYFVDTYEGFTYDEAQNTSDVLWTNTHTDTSMERVQEYLSQYDNFELIKSNIIQDELPAYIEKICVANIDVDMYEAVKGALYKVKDRIVKHGIIIAEDYGHTPALIGAQKATDEFLQENPDEFIPIYLHSGQMFLIKK